MSDVARQAGVSSAAASAVLSGTRSSVRVSETTRTRILQAAQDLQYTRNEIARSLRRQSTDTIGLYVSDRSLKAHGPFLSEIVSGLQQGCDAHRKDLLLHGTLGGQSVDITHGRLFNGKIDGLILLSAPGDPLIDRLAAASLPVVAVAESLPSLPSVIVDDRAGSALLAEYLAAQGYRKVLSRRGPDSRPSSLRRYTAFRQAAAAHRMMVWEDLGRQPDVPDELSPQEKALLSAPSGDRPVVVVCGDDDLADGTIRNCETLGLRVPKDVAVVGFGGLVSRARPSRFLTTISAPWAEAARTAVNLLLGSLAGEEIPLETVLPVRLVVGETA
jgi:LacI family transcriptional regulator